MHIPLQKAILCLDCEVIYQQNGICPNCGSRAGFPVSRWIKTISIISGETDLYNNPINDYQDTELMMQRRRNADR